MRELVLALALALPMSTADAAVDRIRLWRADPAQMVRDLFRTEPDAWQQDALAAFASSDPKTQRIALAACAGPGKSTVESWCGWNFLLCYADQDQHPNGAAVSITGDNLKNGLWKEFAVWYGRSELLQRAFDMTTESIFSRQHPKTWFLGARSFAKKADPDAMGRTLSGLHAPFILYLLDETGDMPPAVGRSAEQGLSNCRWGKIVQAGNTTSQNGYLYQASGPHRHLWHLINITADPDDPKRTPRVLAEWAREQIGLYGRDNPWVMSFILGKFPPGGLNTLLSADEVNEAIGRGVEEETFKYVQKRIGVDVARFGDDRTVLFPRQGLVSFDPVVLRGQRSHTIAGRLMKGKQAWGSELECIDDTGGWASGVIDSCLLGGVSLFSVNASGSPNNPRYFNKRSELYFEGAEWIKRGGSLPQGLTEIVREATAATYWFEGGKFRVIEKAQIKVLLNGTSPDLWEALLQTFALPDMPALGTAQASAGGKMASDYEPLADRGSAGMLS
jgi:hypothetical protein